MSNYGNQPFRLVIAIDFGTSRSGYAYTWKHDSKVIGKLTWPGQKHIKYPKTSTHLLYSPDGKLEKWGAEAMNELAKHRENDEVYNYFFDNFKMELYNPTHITSDGQPYILRKGKEFLLVNLISDYLRELKKLALEDLKQATDKDWENSREIRWVLTVPAIWTDASKQLMRKAARKAGLIGVGLLFNPFTFRTGGTEDECLFLALEPEAAAIYCQERDQEVSQALSKSGTRFMIVDCGGGTIDITVHEVISRGGFKEVVMGTGGSHGSTYVDKSFMEYLGRPNVLTAEALNDFQKQYPKSFLKMKKEWEGTKCSIGIEDEAIYFSIPSELHALLKRIYPHVLKNLSKAQEGDEYTIWLTNKVIKGEIFGPTLDKVALKVEDIFKELDYQKLHIMFLVGGFSNSPLLLERIREQFAKRVNKIIRPEIPSAAIVEGAASFGRNPFVIRARRTRLTYGIDSAMPFESNFDLESKKYWHKYREKYYCKARFSIFVTAGESIGTDEEYTRIYNPSEPNQTSMDITFYSTPKKKVRYIDESHVTELRKVTIDMPDTIGGLDRKVKVTMYFGRTEVECVAKDLTSGKEVKTQLDFTYTYFSEQLGD